MKFDLKKTGAIGILFSIALGFAQMTWATIEGIKERLSKQSERIISMEEREKSSTELLKEVRNDVKLLLQRRR